MNEALIFLSVVLIAVVAFTLQRQGWIEKTTDAQISILKYQIEYMDGTTDKRILQLHHRLERLEAKIEQM